MTDRFERYRREWFADGAGVRADVLAGIVVALALIPEAIGSSIIGGVDPRAGLYASAGALDMIVGRLRKKSRAVTVIGCTEASADLVERFALHDWTGFKLGAVLH